MKKNTFPLLMFKFLFCLCAAGVVSVSARAAEVEWDAVDRDELAAGEELIVVYEKKAPAVIAPPVFRQAMRSMLHQAAGTELKRRFNIIPGEIVHVPDAVALQAAAQVYASDPNVKYVEPNYKVEACAVPNDPDWDELWGMRRISAPFAWDYVTGGTNVVVGIIDSGTDLQHPDLIGNLWKNPGESSVPNGLDDDGNGFIDDIFGWDFYADDDDPDDENLHGTHVAGTVGAVGNNATGVVGVCWQTEQMILRFLGPTGGGSLGGAIGAVEYATMMKTDHGVNIRVLNNSWGGGGPSVALEDAIRASIDAGILFVAAAGNSSMDNDRFAHYPSSYDLDGILSVASIDNEGNLSDFSNYGETSVDIGAPGTDIYSTFPTDFTMEMLGAGFSNNYETISGTSMAAPHVAGAAALILNWFPGLSPEIVKFIIMRSAGRNGALEGRCVTGRELNLERIFEPFVYPDEPVRIVATTDGVYNPSNTLYTVYNLSPDPIDWTVETDLDWLEISPSNFTVAGVSSQLVSVVASSNVLTYPEGIYTGEVSFVNQTTDEGSTTIDAYLKVIRNYKVVSADFQWRPWAETNSEGRITNSYQTLSISSGDRVDSVQIPFPFRFYSESYDTLYIGQDGIFGVNSGGLDSGENVDMPEVGNPSGYGAVLWDDLAMMPSGFATWSLHGTEAQSNRFAALTWYGSAATNDMSEQMTFQAIFHEAKSNNNSLIVFQYDEVAEENSLNGYGRSATVGLEEQWGLASARYSYNGSRLLAEEQAILFTQDPPVDSTSPSGVVSVENWTTSSVTFRIRFSEIVEDFTAADVNISGGPYAAPGASVAGFEGGGELFFVEVDGITGLGQVEISIPPGSLFDLAGNPNVLVGPYLFVMPYVETVFSDDMENGQGEWTASETNYAAVLADIWEVGVPTFTHGPPNTPSGTNCWGTLLDSDVYTRDTCRGWLETPHISVGDNPMVSFKLWTHTWGVELPEYPCYVQISNGKGWETIDVLFGDTAGWETRDYALGDEYSNTDVQMRFFVFDWPFGAGVYIDDLEVYSSKGDGLVVVDRTTNPDPISPGDTVDLDAQIYNMDTDYTGSVTGRLSAVSAGVDAGGSVVFGSVAPGQAMWSPSSWSFTVGDASELDANRICLSLEISGPDGPIRSEYLYFDIDGMPDTWGSNVLEITSSSGVKNWMDEFLQGDGAEGSSVFQLLYAGTNGAIDMPQDSGAPGGDDKLIYSREDRSAIGYFGEGNVASNLGLFRKQFAHSLATNDSVFVRAWDSFSIGDSVAYGDSTLETVPVAPNATVDFGSWVVDTPRNSTNDYNGDSIPDAWYISRGLDPRVPVGDPLENEWEAVTAYGGRSSETESMKLPADVDVSSNFVFVLDSANSRIQVFNRQNFELEGMVGAAGTNRLQFSNPQGLALDPRPGEYRLAVADTQNNRIQLLSFDPAYPTNMTHVWTIGEPGPAGGGTNYFQLESPGDVAIDMMGRVYVADTGAQGYYFSGHSRIMRYDESGASPEVMAVYMLYSTEGVYYPEGISVDTNYNFVVADTAANRIRAYNSGGGLDWSVGSSGTGPLEFRFPKDVEVDAAGRIYVADSGNNRIQILSGSGGFLAAFGSYGSDIGYLNKPHGVARDSNTNHIYVADTLNDRIQLFRVTLDSDGDGMNDFWEDSVGLNSSDGSDAFVDSDGDGVLNIGEYTLGMNPTDLDSDRDGQDDGSSVGATSSGSILEVLPSDKVHLKMHAQGMLVMWQVKEGDRYTVEHASSLGGPWVAPQGVITSKFNGTYTWIDGNYSGDKMRFYRVRRLD